MDMSNAAASMNFTEKQQGNAILDKLQTQRAKGQFCDVEFLVSNQIFKAHRNVVAACSPYLDTILKINVTGCDQVIVECKQTVFQMLLDYIYTGSICVKIDTIEELVQLSNRFLIPQIKGYCSEFLEHNINVSNCFMTRDIAQKCGLTTLMKTVDAFLLANIIDVVQQDEILQLPEKKIQEFVSNKTMPVREELKVHVINRWVRRNMDVRQSRFQQLLGLLAWDRVSASVIHTILEEDQLYQDSEWCLFSMLKFMDEHNILSAAYRPPLDHLRLMYVQTESVTQPQLAMAHQQHRENNQAETKRVPHTPVKHEISASQMQKSFSSRSSVLLEQSTLQDPHTRTTMQDPHTRKTLQDPHTRTTLQDPHTGTTLQDLHTGLTLQNSHTGRALQDPHTRTTLQDLHTGTTLQDLHTGTTLQNSHTGRALQDSHTETTLRDSQTETTLQDPNTRTTLQEHQTATHDRADSDASQSDIMLSTAGEIVEEHHSQENRVLNTGLAGENQQLEIARFSTEFVDVDVDSALDMMGHSDSLPSSVSDQDRGRAKHKRKGIPVKIDHSPITVRIPKSKLQLDSSQHCLSKRRGRPPKLGCKKDRRKPNKLKQKAVKKEHNEVMEQDEDSIEGDKSLITDFETESQGYPEGNPKYLKKSSHKKNKRGRKLKGSIKLQCDECSFTTTLEDKLERHQDTAHKDKHTYACSLCSFQSTWNRQYYHHMKVHFPGPPFVCDYACGYSADRIQQLLYHRMSHTDERPYECTVCKLTFRSKNNLAMHVRCHTGAKPYKCKVCDRCFATKGTLDQHSVTHSDLRPYLCDLCGFSTKYQSHLIAHKRIHTGDVFHCQYANCKYSTPKRSQLACHMRIHMSLRSHICSTCGRGFVEKSHLVRHEKIHLSDKPYKCQYCNYGSTRRDKLKDHMVKYHEMQDGSLPRTPYKARKPRRQTYDPQAFPLLTSEQASHQMQCLLQQSDTARQQQCVGSSMTDDDCKSSAASHSAPNQDTYPYPLITDPHPSLSESQAPLDAVMPEQNSSQDSVADPVQSMLPSLLVPRLLMASSPTSQASAPPVCSHTSHTQPDLPLPNLPGYMGIF